MKGFDDIISSFGAIILYKINLFSDSLLRFQVSFEVSFGNFFVFLLFILKNFLVQGTFYFKYHLKINCAY